MASAPPADLPLFYNDLIPLNSRDHATWKSKQLDSAKWLETQHAVPLTSDEFVQAQRDYPIVFSSGENPLPLALMGLNEGINTFVDEHGKVNEPVYIPAYIRRYPYLLAKLRPDSDEMSLCFDPTAGAIGTFEDGDALFDGDQPSEQIQSILKFCEEFEQAGARTKAFVDELKANDLLMDGEIAISTHENPDKPYVYRGFQMVNQEKLQKIPARKLKEWNDNGLSMLIHAHLFSLDLMRVIFGRQQQQGKGPLIAG